MYHIAERNERHSRRHALVLAIALHIALAAVLYLYTSAEISAADTKKSEPAKTEQKSPAPKPKAVKLP